MRESTLSEIDRVLVVDDHSTSRMKLTAAVRKLGFAVETAGEGAAAIALLREQPVDAILLDIVMPVMDGFEVLTALKTDPDLCDIPVIVVSAMEDDTGSVVRAIELGAEDFLPKDFDPVILRARLSSSLEKKHNRDREREFRRHVDQLTVAAEELETGLFQPDRLHVDSVADRSDNLGRLARVFKAMAEEIYRRELRLRKNVRALRGSLLVIAVGVIWGLIAPLSRMAAGLEAQPVALAFWTNLIAAAACYGACILRGKSVRPDWPLVKFCALWGVLIGVLLQLVIYSATEHVHATTISLIATLEGFMVFTIAVLLKLEAASMKRLAGLVIGLAGAVLVILSRDSIEGGDTGFWLVIAACVPLILAVEGIFISARRPSGADIVHATALMSAISCAITLALALIIGAPVTYPDPGVDLATVISLIGLATAAATVLALHLVIVAGPVFAGQSAYMIAVAGIVWSMLLLDESMSALAWGALLFMMVGLYFVEPQSSADDYEFRLPFGSRTRVGRRKVK